MCGPAQLSHPLFVLFSCCSRCVDFFKLIHLNDLLDNDISEPKSVTIQISQNTYSNPQYFGYSNNFTINMETGF